MAYIDFRINCSFFESYYKTNKNVLLKEKFNDYSLPIYVTFNQNDTVSFHFFLYKSQEDQELNSSFVTVTLYCKKNGMLVEKTEEGWGYLSSSNPIVVTFKMKSFCKLLDNEDNNLEYQLKFQEFYKYKYLFPFSKLVSTYGENKNSNIFWVSLIKSFGILYLKCKDHIFDENIEKCYSYYFLNPSKSSFNDFISYFNMKSISENIISQDKIRISYNIGDTDIIKILKCMFIESASYTTSGKTIRIDPYTKNDLDKNRIQKGVEQDIDNEQGSSSKKKKGKLSSYKIYIKSCNDSMYICIPEEEFNENDYNAQDNDYIINVNARFFGSDDINTINHPYLIEVQDNQSIKTTFDKNKLLFQVFNDGSQIKANFIDKSLSEIILESEKMVPDNDHIKSEDKNENTNDKANVNNSDDPIIEEEEIPDDDADTPLLHINKYESKYFNELNEHSPKNIVKIEQSEKSVKEGQIPKFLYALCRDQIPAIYFNAFPFRFNLNNTIFISAPYSLQLLYELKEEISKEISKEITLSFYDSAKIEDDSFIITENENNYLVFHAFMKDIPHHLFFKIALGEKKIEDISQIFIIWHYELGYGDLLKLSSYPTFTFELNEDDPKYLIRSRKLYPFNVLDDCNYEINIEIITVAYVENLVNSQKKDLFSSSFTLH